MALFDECMQKCAQKVLDLADIVRDGDLSPSENASPRQAPQRGSEGQSDHDPLNGTAQHQPDIESENEHGGRAYTSVSDQPRRQSPRIIAQSCEG